MISIILAGGYGRRLWPPTRRIAKPLLPIGERCIMDYIMEKLMGLDEVDKIIISTNLLFGDESLKLS